jgi:dTDP-4-dehydrorhamnose 3,5-epimerase
VIEGVVLKPLVVHSDDRGFFLEVLRADDPFYRKFGQSSFTMTYPGVVKAFHYHRLQDDLWFVAAGMAQVVLYDLREDSPTYRQTNVFYLGEDNRQLLVIPVGVAHGYRVLGTKPVLLFYHTTEPYNPQQPDEYRIPWNDPTIGFDWTTKNR